MLMILLLSESDVSRVVSMRDGVRVVEQALRQHAAGAGVAMPRVSAEVPGTGGGLRVMVAIMPDIEYFGLKKLNGYPGRRLPGVNYFALVVVRLGTRALRARVDGDR